MSMNDGSSLNSGETTYMEFREVGNQNTHARAHTLKTVTDFDSRHNLMSTDRARPTAKKNKSKQGYKVLYPK